MNWITFIYFFALCQGAGILGSAFTFKAIPSWYNTLVAPSFRPPSWVFGPVWTLLYTLMAVSGYILWQNREQKDAKTALVFFFIQLALNAIWTPIFFGAKRLDLAFYEIVAMWVFILLTMVFAFKVKPVAGWLLLPYIAWVTFASILNFSFWQLNK
jgi:tryptophan-rich sensory protein